MILKSGILYHKITPGDYILNYIHYSNTVYSPIDISLWNNNIRLYSFRAERGIDLTNYPSTLVILRLASTALITTTNTEEASVILDDLSIELTRRSNHCAVI